MIPRPFEVRRGLMLELREAGYTLAEIGTCFGISRQRVFQVIGKGDQVKEVVDAPQLQEASHG